MHNFELAMAKLREEAEAKPDDLEIISIGSLYKGPLDKKYWSCSRGKDRYPYPVGYQAVRAQDGNRCKIEIHEGSKGPVFVITSADGLPYRGETPAIAWEKFQKKCFPHMKIWHGKRFSCKIDGIEFFGFKNPFVQRLLRELVANLDGEAERSLLSSIFCNGASILEQERGCMNLCAYPDLLTCIPKPPTTGKRSQRCGTVKRLEIGGSWKRLERQIQSSTKGSHSRQKRQKNCRNAIFSEGNNVRTESPAPFQRQTSLHNLILSDKADEDGPAASIHKKDRIIDSVELSNDTGRADIPEGSNDGPGNCVSTEIFGSTCKMGEPLDRLQISEVRQMNSSMAMVNKEEGGFAADSMGPNDEILCVDDTLNELQDNPCGHATISQNHSKLEDESGADHAVKPEAPLKDSPSNLEDKSPAANMVKTEPLADESYPEEETGPYVSAGSSERSDFDSVGQEIDMMTFLLPQAVPLLKYSRKRKKIKSRGNIAENSSNALKSGESGKPGTSDAKLSGYTHMKQEVLPIQARNADIAVRNPENTESTAFEKLEVDECVNQTHYQDVPDSVDINGTASTLYHEKQQNLCDKKPLEDDANLNGHVLHQKSCIESHFSENVSASLDINTISFKKHSEDLKAAKAFSADGNDTRTSDQKNGGDGTFSAGCRPSNCILTMVLEGEYGVPLSESIICRNSANDYLPEAYLSNANVPAEKFHKPSSKDKTNHSSYNTGESVLEGDSNVLQISTVTLKAEDELNVWPAILENQTSIYTSKNNNSSNSFVPSVSQVKESQALVLIDEKKHTAHSEDSIPSSGPAAGFSDELFIIAEVRAGLRPELTGNVKLHNELEGIVQLVGCYLHCLPILSVLLRRMGNEIYVCVQSGLLVGEVQTLFLYKLLLEEPRKGCPSFVGHTSVLPPGTDDAYHYGVEKDESWYQITPDGQSVVLLGNVKIPFCREQRISCLCSTCASFLLDGSTVRIVHLNVGYVTVVLELKAIDNLLSVLVCDPNYLVAVGENGRLHLWIMNPSWSGHVDEFDLPTCDRLSPCIVELQKVPNCAALVVGYNGFGEFSLWDISRRVLLSKFSSPNTSLHHFLPIGSLSCSWKNLSSSKSDDHINSIMASTNKSFKNPGDSYCFHQEEGQEVAVWLLASAALDSESDYQPNAAALGIDSVALWRLALLAKNSVILGSPLDTRASSVGALSGNGIVGTKDGLVYMWDLSNGNTLGNLHHFKGGSVSCIATDDSTSSVVAVASENGELMIYQSCQIHEVDTRK